MMHAGQICMSTERVIVQKTVSAALINKVTSLCRSLKAGDCRTDPTVKLPAVMNEVFAENILGMMREAKDAGAEIVLGDLTGLIGLTCSPISVVGVGSGSECSSNVVCCSNTQVVSDTRLYSC